MAKGLKTEELTYHNELHHTCNNPDICKKQVSPCARCGDCRYYNLREVEVADNPIRQSDGWGF